MAIENVLVVEGLEQHLHDKERDEDFFVRVDDRIAIPHGSMAAILGPSGCGKTTLLSVLGLLRAPSNVVDMKTFEISVGEGKDVVKYDLKEIYHRKRHRQIEAIRRKHIGFALQSGELLPSLTAEENIAIPLQLNGFDSASVRSRVSELVRSFGLEGKTEQENRRVAHSRVNTLSGGEYQRVALARAIAHRPALVFVDEPTASLNRELARGALEQLLALHTSGARRGAIIMITHDVELAEEFANVIITMEPFVEKKIEESKKKKSETNDENEQIERVVGGRVVDVKYKPVRR